MTWMIRGYHQFWGLNRWIPLKPMMWWCGKLNNRPSPIKFSELGYAPGNGNIFIVALKWFVNGIVYYWVCHHAYIVICRCVFFKKTIPWNWFGSVGFPNKIYRRLLAIPFDRWLHTNHVNATRAVVGAQMTICALLSCHAEKEPRSNCTRTTSYNQVN